MEEKTSDSPKKAHSLGPKLFTFVTLIVLAATFGTAMIVYNISANHINDYYIQLTQDTARNFAAIIDGDALTSIRYELESDEYQALRQQAEDEDNEELVRQYLTDKGLWNSYREIQGDIMIYLENMDQVEYIYIVSTADSTDTADMYIMDDEDSPLYTAGYYSPRPVEFMGTDATREIEPTISKTEWGWLCSTYAPVVNSQGRTVALVGCDMSMDDVMASRRVFLATLMGITFLLTAAVLAGAMLFFNRSVIGPLRDISAGIKRFKPEKDKDYDEAGVIDLGITTHDEISDIYESIRTMQMDIIDYLNDLDDLQKDVEKAESDIRDKEETIGQIQQEVYRDALTRVGSKALYLKKVEELTQQIAEGTARFAIVMVDLNDLKKINDTWGHRSGDLYIQGCCHLICEVFKHSPVYRVGGDEFVSVLTGDDYEDREELSDRLRQCYDLTWRDQNVKGWLRYSAAVGMSEFRPGDDKVEQVFKRADEAMYTEKEAFKKSNGTYR